MRSPTVLHTNTTIVLLDEISSVSPPAPIWLLFFFSLSLFPLPRGGQVMQQKKMVGAVLQSVGLAT